MTGEVEGCTILKSGSSTTLPSSAFFPVDAGELVHAGTRAAAGAQTEEGEVGIAQRGHAAVLVGLAIRVDLARQLTPIPNLFINGAPSTRTWRLHFNLGHTF